MSRENTSEHSSELPPHGFDCPCDECEAHFAEPATPEQSTERWQIHGRFVIDADTEDQASAACEALERAGRRSKGMANVTIHVHASEATEETCS